MINGGKNFTQSTLVDVDGFSHDLKVMHSPNVVIPFNSLPAVNRNQQQCLDTLDVANTAVNRWLGYDPFMPYSLDGSAECSGLYLRAAHDGVPPEPADVGLVSPPRELRQDMPRTVNGSHLLREVDVSSAPKSFHNKVIAEHVRRLPVGEQFRVDDVVQWAHRHRLKYDDVKDIVNLLFRNDEIVRVVPVSQSDEGSYARTVGIGDLVFMRPEQS